MNSFYDEIDGMLFNIRDVNNIVTYWFRYNPIWIVRSTKLFYIID